MAPVLEQGNDRTLLEIGHNAAWVPQERQFIDAQPLRCREDRRLIEMPDMLVKDVAHGLLVQSAFLGDTDEGAAERRFSKLFEQPLGHLMFLIHVGERLEHGMVAIGAPIPLPLHMDANAFAVHREVEEELRPFAEALQVAKTPARDAYTGSDIVRRGDLVVPWSVNRVKDRPVR